MNIKEAKQEVENTIRAYLYKDETGAYAIPVEKQRPLLLIGPPGIGKTAIMEQVAAEMHINLVSYTITHHTRQSAIGLPFISKRDYGGREYSVTEYTMSEIIASVYDQIARSGVKEGILFLDEINCVSETLAPTMLQFLQYKTFGTHRVPDGFVIVTAGNPPQYNKSVRDFDIVTLDRVRKIVIDEDFDAFREYAVANGVHGAVLGYLAIHHEDFYRIRTEAEDRFFVTARGWEDLSRVILVYEKLGLSVDKKLCVQYLQDPETAERFAAYYELWNKYRTVYHIPEILSGEALANPTWVRQAEGLSGAPFDEKLSILSLLSDALNAEFRTYAEEKRVAETVFGLLKQVKAACGVDGLPNAAARAKGETVRSLFDGTVSAYRKDLKKQNDARMLSRDEIRVGALTQKVLEEMGRGLSGAGAGALSTAGDGDQAGQAAAADAGAPADDSAAQGSFGPTFADIRALFAAREKARAAHAQETGDHLTNTFAFLDRIFGEGQEMVLFLTELSRNAACLQFVNECGNDAYYHYNKLLLLKDREDSLRQEIAAMKL